MTTKNLFSTLLLFVMLFSVMHCSKSPKFDHYGIYIKTENDFKEIKGYEWSGMNSVYQNSRNYDKTEIILDNNLEIYVYSPKAKTNEYHLIFPNKKNRNGDFKCANLGYGRDCPEREITVAPIKKIDDMVVIKSEIFTGIFILHIKEESKGYVFKIIGGKGTVTDIDGNVYQTMVIGDQEWMIENLKVTHYRNGDPIPKVKSDSTWAGLLSGSYCVHDNNPSNGETYGNLYNWYAVNDSRGLAPEGWHVPTDNEITQLTDLFGENEGSKLAGGYDLWNNGVLRIDPEFDTSGFSFLPGGYRNGYGGHFYGMGYAGFFWSSTESGSNDAWARDLGSNATTVGRYGNRKRYGFSVRCVRD